MAQPLKYPMHVHSTLMLLSREDVRQGIANTRERRKYQNRINQRARRSRRRNAAKAPIDGSEHANVTQTDSPLTSRHVVPTSVPQLDIGKIWEVIKALDTHSWENTPLIQAFKDSMYRNWLVKAPLPALLPSLVQFNLMQAFMLNAVTLGLTIRQLEDDAISHFYMARPWPPSVNLKVDTLPSALRPTDLQRRTFHHPWFDLIPIPQMRDNLFRRGMQYIDEDDLCSAVGGFAAGKNAGFLVWGNAGDSYSWEVTEAFLRSSWGWVIEGCWELFESTNKWRAQRGEPPLFNSASQNTY
ncbi:hypothetical protein F5Y12DRAFT_787272 [Xylaria sp. FL1777]|nr:hypothetical protein F5Y12DRAFT_787272 [Xylaria sp. FL1777]